MASMLDKAYQDYVKQQSTLANHGSSTNNNYAAIMQELAKSGADMSKYNPSLNPSYTRDDLKTDILAGAGITVPSGGSSGGGGSNYASDLSDYYRSLNENARSQAIAAIEAMLQANLKDYEIQRKNSDDSYQSLINQSESRKYRNASLVRQNQADRGQLNSGLGRQELLNMGTSYGNQLNNILLQRQNARDTIDSNIIKAKAQAESDKANVNQQYALAISRYL